MLFFVPYVLAQTPVQSSGKKSKDTTATKSGQQKPKTSPKSSVDQKKNPLPKDTTAVKKAAPVKEEEDEGDEVEEDSTAAPEHPIKDAGNVTKHVEEDSTAAQDHPIKHSGNVTKREVPDDEDESGTAWQLETKIDYDTWRIRRGVASTSGIPSLTPGAILTHETGLSAELDAQTTIGSRLQFTLWSLTLAYEYEYSDWATGTFQYARYRFTDPGENSVASKFNCWTFMGTFDARICEIDITADLYPGQSTVIYITFDLSKEFTAGDFTFTPTFESCYLQENFHVDLPGRLGSHDIYIHDVATLSLQCPIDYQVTDQLYFSFNPQFTRFPITEITSKIRGFSTTLTASYTFDF
ncbi:MAG TPA: hypothetical protein VK569_00570 [Bacteroidota bacterium]|nr:hypothetical protein [Bacteroidota bacterium]